MGLMDLYHKYREPIDYVFYGGLTTVVCWFSYMLFIWLGIEANLSNILSWIAGVTFAFVVNKWFVFRNRSTSPKVVLTELVSFFGARIFTGIVAAVLFYLMHDIWGMNQVFMGTEGLHVKIITSVIEIALNYIFSKYMVFRENNGKKE